MTREEFELYTKAADAIMFALDDLRRMSPAHPTAKLCLAEALSKLLEAQSALDTACKADFPEGEP